MYLLHCPMHLRIRYALLVLLSLVVLDSCSIGRMICDVALTPKTVYRDINEARDIAEKRYPGLISWYDSLRADGIFRDTVITGETGVRIHAVYAGLPQSEGTAIVIHGYCSNHIGMLHLARMYRDSLHFNVLVPDLQYHGLSEGVVRMGWYDRLDARRWVDVACGLWNDDFMVVHGVSMGAATTMMLSGEPDLPENLRCFIEDCGYASVWEQYDNLRRQHTILNEKALQKASDYCYRTYGWNFKEASSVDQLARCDRPMFFIHGQPDRFVSVDFVYECYNAKTKGYKEIWVEPDTPEHALMYLRHTEEYTSHVIKFIDKVRNMTKSHTVS